ncbi:MAG: AAA family ATPase [Paracoccaceae bacterium]|nr:AAA family ATPase [Paracoccaceae bacterium]
MPNLEDWLQSIGCGDYIDAFRDADVSFDLVRELNSEDLRELGLSLGDRKRFLRAVAELTAGDGAAAVQNAEEAAPEPEPYHVAQAERRRLTVMFVDLVGSTAQSSALDPEEWSEVIQAYQDAVAGVVTRYDGHIAQYLGDGVLCYFGWPRALEAAAERAVNAGLAIMTAIEKVKIGGEPLSCRIGIATGLVVVGDIGVDHESTAIGETPNFAARLQGFAKPGQVVISESTHRLLGTAFKVESLGKHGLKGIPGEQEIFAVIGAASSHDRFAARAAQSVGEMVGRGNELALLTDRWNTSVAGEGQIVLLTGEAGIGKSRVCRALFDSISRDDYVRVRFQCSPYQRDTALWPVINQMTSAAGIEPSQTNDEKLDRLEQLLRSAGEVSEQDIALIADLLGLPADMRYGPMDLPPPARRAATFSALADHAVNLSRNEPLLLLVEDSHWIDPTTLELIGILGDRTERERVMLLVTSRPENQPDLPPLPHVTSLALNRLGRAGVEEIVNRLGGGKLPPEAITAIIERTDGVPLFVEELTKALIESGEDKVPASLHDTLMARLDRLPEVKEVAQIASVIGREFDADPLAQIAALSQQKVITALENLRRVELVFPRGGRSGHYIFKHALVRDAAYESLLNRRRQEIHSRIFDVLRENELTMPGVLANHAAEAGRFKEAVQYGRFAAEEALRRPAYAEAITHLETALGVLALRDPSEAVQRERIRLLLLAGQARIAHNGYAAEATVATFGEIERIATEIDDKELLVEGLYGRWAAHYVPGRLRPALDIADSILAVNEEVEDRLARALGHRLRGTVLTMMGRIAEATPELGAVDEFYDRQAHVGQASRFGQDVGIARDCYRLGTLTLQGRYDSASALARQVIVDLDTVNHAHTSGYALGHLALFLCATEIEPLGTEVAETCIELSERNRMPLWAALGHAARAMAQVNRGADAEALPEFTDALAMLSDLSFDLFRPMLLPAHSLALARTGDFETAGAELAEARGCVTSDEARFAEPEIYRVEGQLALLQGDRAAAKASLIEALEKAVALGHLSWQLRAAEDLAGILSEDGDDGSAREILGDTLSGFSEGSDMPPLIRASKLIEAG